MQIEPVPIDVFINSSFNNPRVSSIINTWKIETIHVQAILVREFREMGVFFASPEHNKILLETIITLLKNSREIKNMLAKAEKEDENRKRNRHEEL